MFEFLACALLAMAAGGSVVTQQLLNAHLRAALGSAVWSGFASYAVGLTSMALLAIVLRDPVPSLGTAARVPWWDWSGGVFGAAFIAVAILLLPRLGAATFIGLLVSGQMLASLAFDHVGAMGLAQRPFDLTRALGVVLLVGGVVLIRR